MHNLTDLRDKFAMAIAQGHMAAMVPENDDVDWISGISPFLSERGIEEYAEHWYRIADAMLRVRNRPATPRIK